MTASVVGGGREGGSASSLPESRPLGFSHLAFLNTPPDLTSKTRTGPHSVGSSLEHGLKSSKRSSISGWPSAASASQFTTPVHGIVRPKSRVPLCSIVCVPCLFHAPFEHGPSHTLGHHRRVGRHLERDRKLRRDLSNAVIRWRIRVDGSVGDIDQRMIRSK